MKKVFTLIAMAVAAMSVNAQTVVFSATPASTLEANWSVPAGSADLEITSAEATIVGGKMYAFSQQADAKDLIKKQGGEYAFQFTNNNTYFKIVLDQALKAGDIISARMQSRTDTDLGIFFNTGARPSETTTAILFPTASEQSWAAAPTYTVAEGDGICGETAIFLYRATGKSTFFNEFVITRTGGTDGISTVSAVAEDAPAFNLAGQKVGAGFKGIAIKGGKKIIVK